MNDDWLASTIAKLWGSRSGLKKKTVIVFVVPHLTQSSVALAIAIGKEPNFASRI